MTAHSYTSLSHVVQRCIRCRLFSQTYFWQCRSVWLWLILPLFLPSNGFLFYINFNHQPQLSQSWKHYSLYYSLPLFLALNSASSFSSTAGGTDFLLLLLEILVGAWTAVIISSTTDGEDRDLSLLCEASGAIFCLVAGDIYIKCDNTNHYCTGYIEVK